MALYFAYIFKITFTQQISFMKFQKLYTSRIKIVKLIKYNCIKLSFMPNVDKALANSRTITAV